MSNVRKFKIAPDRHLTLPLGLQPGPGATHTRLHADNPIVELDFDDPRVQLHQRFLSNRIKVGDLIEVTDQGDVEDDLDTPLPPPPAPSSPARAPFVVNPIDSSAPEGK